MKRLEKLKIIECKYCYAAWKAVCGPDGIRFESRVREYEQPRDVDFYHDCGVYSSAGVPFEICEIDYANYRHYAPYDGITRNFSDAVRDGISDGSGVLIAGGYCNYAPAIAGGIQRALGSAKIGLVWIDAHGDNCIAETSAGPTRLVGVPISTVTGTTLDGYRVNTCGLAVPIPGENILAGDLRIMSEASAQHLCDTRITRLDASAFEDGHIWKSAVENLAERVDALYLSVDADILKASYIPAYDKAVPYGHDIDVVMRNIRIVMETGRVCAYSLFCVDFDHYERGGARTYLSGAELIDAGLHNWKYLPY